MSDVAFQVISPDFRDVIEGVRLLAMPSAQRRRYLSRIGRLVIAQAQKNAQEQKTVDGTPFRKRRKLLDWERKERERIREKGGEMGIAPGAYRKLMLTKLVRSRWMGVKPGDEKAVVYFPANKKIRGHKGEPMEQGYLGYKHQFGDTEEFYRLQEERYFSLEERDPHYREYWRPCTEKQALYLKRYGMPGNVNRIMLKCSAGHAYNIAKKLKKKWNVTVPERPFLGASRKQQIEWGAVILRELHDKFKAKNHLNLLK